MLCLIHTFTQRLDFPRLPVDRRGKGQQSATLIMLVMMVVMMMVVVMFVLRPMMMMLVVRTQSIQNSTQESGIKKSLAGVAIVQRPAYLL